MATPFGRYQLLKRLAVGGMAELFLAQDNERNELLVIKRILPYLSEEPEFVQMFLDEARIAAQLHHENIIQVFELGKLQGSIFIAMEYVEGIDLRKMLQQEEKRQRTLPYGVVAYITAQVCGGLGYAHHSKGVDGRPLEVIHRDVSPQNVMVSFDGDVKLVDFGIAKAGALMERSKPGVIKGKFLYLSPEQLSQERLDHRADLFALGTMMYELTVGKAPFYKTTTEGVIYAIRTEEPIPPEQVRPGFPPALSRIILKCLVKDRARRYQTAFEIQRDLEAFLRELPEPFRKYDLSLYVGRLFGTEDEQTVMHVPGTGDLASYKLGLPAPAVPLNSQPSVPTSSLRGPPMAMETAPIPVRPQVDDEPSTTGTGTTGIGPEGTSPFRSADVDNTGPFTRPPGLDASPPPARGFDPDSTGPEIVRPTLPIVEPPARRPTAGRYLSVDGGEPDSTVTGTAGVKSASARAAELTGSTPSRLNVPPLPSPRPAPPPPAPPVPTFDEEDGTVSEATPDREPDRGSDRGSDRAQEARAYDSSPSLTPQVARPSSYRADPSTRPIRASRMEQTVPEDEPVEDARRPIIFGVVAFVVVLLAGLLGLWLFRAPPDAERPVGPQRPAPASARELQPSPAPPAEGPGEDAPPAQDPPAGTRGEGPNTAGAVGRIAVTFRAPRGTQITHEGSRLAPGEPQMLLPGRFAYQYRCPGRSLVNGGLEVSANRGERMDITLDCRVPR